MTIESLDLPASSGEREVIFKKKVSNIKHFIPVAPNLFAPFDVALAAGAAALSCNVSIAYFPSLVSVTEILSVAIKKRCRMSAPNRFPIFAVDISAVANQLLRFCAALPRVTLYYAVKCNPDPFLITLLARLGACFDCASQEEIDIVAKALGATEEHATLSDRIIFANPIKDLKDLAHARKVDVSLMTFDSIEELEKIANYYHTARLLLRISVEDSSALCPLSSKFGAQMEEVETILDEIERLGLDLVGVAFHVGSGCTSIMSYEEALIASKDVFNRAANRGMKLRILDIGGGFPGHDDEAPITFLSIAKKVSTLIEALFDHDVKVIAEPGRYLVTGAFTMASQVVMATKSEDRAHYYLSDGVFGSFRDAYLLNVCYPPEILWKENDMDTSKYLSNLYGPTQDPIDIISRGLWMPSLDAGDWLLFKNMGAYTRSLATRRTATKHYDALYFFRMPEA